MLLIRMQELKDAMDMPMFSRYGKAQATFLSVHIPGVRRAPKPPPPRQKLEDVTNTQNDLIEALDEVTKELESEAKVKKQRKQPQSAVFLAVSRGQRDHIYKQTSQDNPAPNQYFPTQVLVRPRTAVNLAFHPPQTIPKPRRLTLGSCVSDETLICKFAQKAIDGRPMSKRDPSAQLKTVNLSDYRAAVTERTELFSLTLPASKVPVVDFARQTPRGNTNPKDVCEARFESFNCFPENYSGSKRVPTADFKKAISRKDFLIANQLDEIYDYDSEQIKQRTNVGLMDFTKMSPRSHHRPRIGPESPDFLKLQHAYYRSLPRTYIKSFYIAKQTSRPETAKSTRSVVSPRSAVTTASVGSRTVRSARMKRTNSDLKEVPFSSEFRETYSRHATEE